MIRVTELEELSARQIEALLAIGIETVDFAQRFEREVMIDQLGRAKPALTLDEIDGILIVLYRERNA
jgi:hypothetical protein